MSIDVAVARIESICDRLEGALAQLAQAREKRPNPYAAAREKYPNAGKPWTAQDDEELRRLFGSGNAIEDLSLTFARTPNGIRERLQRLGLLVPQRSGAFAPGL